MHPSRDHHLPPDLSAYRGARHPRGRVIVIAPTRAACETIELALGTERETVLGRAHGAELDRWASAGEGFGIVAGTGTGKTLAIRRMSEAILQETLRYGVVNREREATPETPTWNVVIVTTGIARRWFQDDLITVRDTIIADEIHQTSAELELCLALGKRVGARFIWLSATVDPRFYATYLKSAHVLESTAFDPRLKARVEVMAKDPMEFLDDRTVRRFIKEGRGVAVFVPTRAEVEKLAGELGARWPKLNAAFYHGGEPIRKIRPFLEGAEKPFLLAMTAAGQSAINVPGLDTVVIYDARYGNVVERGRNVLHRLYLGANEILQMAGRVHGRVPRGEVTILSDRPLRFEDLTPTPPEFQLAGDSERVALTCAALGVDASELDLPVPLDRVGYRRALETLTSRGLIKQGRLTEYGREVEAMPVERPWGELLISAEAELHPILAVVSNVESLHRMTREDRDLEGAIVKGSDHLTIYNLYAEAVNRYGGVGEVFGLARHTFEEGINDWAEHRGVLVKSIEDAAMGVAAVYRSLEQPLPRQLPYATRELREKFLELLARVMPLDLVIDEQTVDGQQARLSKTSVAGGWGPIAGSLRYFADKFGGARASIEGTTIPSEAIRRYATAGPPNVSIGGPRKHQGLRANRTLTYGGFTLETESAPIRGTFPKDLVEAARRALAEALIAGETAHPDQGKVRRVVRQLEEFWRRSGGTLESASPDAVQAAVLELMNEINSWEDFLRAPFELDLDQRVSIPDQVRLNALPTSVRLKGDAAMIEYDLDRGRPVARLRLREGQARRLGDEDLPELDRPLRFSVARGDDPPIVAESLDQLKSLLRSQHPRAQTGRRRNTRGPRPPKRRR
ncbi:MAG: helicase-related protein [Gemmatimonadota bacterium]